LPDLAPRTLVLNGVSKAYSMTGWRIGYAGGPAEVIKAMTKVQSQSTSNPTSISQVAAQAALEGPQDCIGTMLKAFKERHDHVVERLNAIPGIECLPTDGTFYVFPSVQQAIDGWPGSIMTWSSPNTCSSTPGSPWCPDRPSAFRGTCGSRSPPARQPGPGIGFV
jgi:aspartate aminotransferase